MKFKKMLAALFTSVLLLTFSTPVGAVTGIGDTKETALTLVPKQEYNLFLSDRSDKYWFKWTNNTGEFKSILGFLNPSKGDCDFRLGLIIRYGDGNESAILYTQNLGGANSRYFDNILVPNGASVYLVVDSDKKFAVEQYSLTFTYFNYTQ